MKKNFVLGIFGLLVVFGFVLGVGVNFRDYNVDRSVYWNIVIDDNEFIDLILIQFYVYINDGGVLVVDISLNNLNYLGYGMGLSLNLEYNFDEVFEVSNDLWEEGMLIVVRIISDNIMIQFYGYEFDVYDSIIGQIVYVSDMVRNDVCFVVNNGDVVKVGMDFIVVNDVLGIINNVVVYIEVYRFGIEFVEIVGNCGQL